MGVYIKGIDMPKEDEGIYIFIRNNGVVECVKTIFSRCDDEPTTLVEMDKAKATYIPEPHGRLIDEGSLTKYFNVYRYEEWTSEEVGRLINNASTVIEGSE